MSELKEYLCVEALVPEKKEIPGYLMHMAKYRAPQAEMELVYLKYEADAVIKELKAQKAQAEDDCVFWKKKYNDCKRELDLLKDTNIFYNGGRQ